MIIDLSISNFRSFQEDQTLSMNVESARNKLPSNFTVAEDGKIRVLRSSAIFGPNASGKSNLLTALRALKWIVRSSGELKEGQPIPPFEPFRLDEEALIRPVKFELEFIVPSGSRYRYEVAYDRYKVTEERLYSLARRSRAMIFERNPSDTWETIKFGGTYKGGSRRFPFFPNSAYLSRAGNDASAPDFIREIFDYFRNISFLNSGKKIISTAARTNPRTLSLVSKLICLADTGVSNVTLEEGDNDEIKFPDSMPLDLKEAILLENKFSPKYWIESRNGKPVAFDTDEMSDGTVRLFDIIPIVLETLSSGTVLLMDEIDAHFHTDIVNLILRLFHDDEINAKGAQLIFTTHDTNIMDSSLLRRDQIWFVSKLDGASSIRSLDEYDKNLIRHDSPFEAFYMDGRFGALPRVSFGDVKYSILSAFAAKAADKKGKSDA